VIYALNEDEVPENHQMNRREEPTKAPTPDKMDRSMKARKDGKPYPLTEEEATPNTPMSQQM
jgi:hypothetical protein